ncbi:Rieske (2Fe-2S) protein [Amorphus sp. 3PC139-8]|uniref:Rieske (2Fe-2S) protein n=1 Tax=Amorphus sp. 3PC139-8 TaxID=2735676 RepID=UPI00345D08C2
MSKTYVCAEAELADGDVRVVEVGDVEIGVFRHGDQYYGYRNVCPHQGGPVCEGMRIAKVTMELDEVRRFRRHNFDRSDMHVVCPWHGWEFRLETGEAAGDPAIRLKRYTVKAQDGGIYVDA